MCMYQKLSDLRKSRRSVAYSCIAMIPVSLLAAVVPYALMGSCMMETMTCNALTKPAVAVVSVLVLITAVIDVIVLFKNRGAEGKMERKGE